MTFSYLTVPLVSGGWGGSSQINEVFGVLPSTPADTITHGEYAEASRLKKGKAVWAPLLRGCRLLMMTDGENNIQRRNN